MVDISTIFIVYEFIKEYFGVDKVQLDRLGILILFGVGVLFLVISFITRPSKAQEQITVSGVTKWIGFFCFFLCLAFYLAQPTNLLYISVQNFFGLEKKEFLITSTCIIAPAVTVISFIISRFMSKEPNNNSYLNWRQRFGVIAFISGVASVFLLTWYFQRTVMTTVLIWIIVICEVFNLLFWFYDPFVYIFSKFVKVKTQMAVEPTPGRVNSFAIIGCAHNEEAVIANLIQSVYRNSYPKDKYDMYVICDNCDDNTASEVRKAGAIAMERQDHERRGKGFGLDWMFDILKEKAEQGQAYDAYIVLDADNVVNEGFLEEVNMRMNEGFEILQAYLGCKNPSDTWVSKCYSLAYWLSNTNFQNAHYKVGLSAQMGGTGMIIRPSVLDEVGWKTDSLTEDLVLTARYVLKKNRACCWVHEARLYDEKPLKIKPSIRQRTRWMQGHMDAMIHYGLRLFGQGVRHLSWKQMDMGMYLLRPFLNMIMFIVYLARIVSIFFFPGSVLTQSFIMGVRAATLLLLTYFIMQFYVLNDEKYLRFSIWLPLGWVFTYTWYPPYFRGFIKRKEKYWVSTVHERNMAITDVTEAAELEEAKTMLAGLNNLNRFPLGQLLLKATVISKKQLEQALIHQNDKGGFLGDIIVELGILPQNTLQAYLNLQNAAREEEKEAERDESLPKIGEILVNAGLINQEDLESAFKYQKASGKRIGRCLIETGKLTEEILQIFLSIQQVLQNNYVDQDLACKMLREGAQNGASAVAILRGCRLISDQQLKAFENREDAPTDEEIGMYLVEKGYIAQSVLDMVDELKYFFKEKGKA